MRRAAFALLAAVLWNGAAVAQQVEPDVPERAAPDQDRGGDRDDSPPAMVVRSATPAPAPTGAGKTRGLGIRSLPWQTGVYQ